jgi:hypothetical protein
MFLSVVMCASNVFSASAAHFPFSNCCHSISNVVDIPRESKVLRHMAGVR